MWMLILILMCMTCPAFAADYYIADVQSGSGDASSCANAKAYSWNWLNPNVADGDTVYLCGRITNTLSIPKSGTSTGITVKFCKDGEANCGTGNQGRFSKDYWGTGSNAAIYSSGKNRIIIDGNGVGVIECTNNGDTGSGKAYDRSANAVDITSSNNWEIKNLIIKNIYVHTYNNSSHTSSFGVRAFDGSYLSVHDNTIDNAYYGIMGATSSSSISNISIYNNSISACSTAIVVALGSSGTAINNVRIYNNDVSMGANWYDTLNYNHVDGVHMWAAAYSPAQITDVQIYRNYFHGDCGGHSTGYIYLEYDIISPYIFSNVMVSTANKPANGHIAMKSQTTTPSSSPRIYSNTMVGLTGAGIGIYLNSNSNVTAYIANNIFSTLMVGIYEPNKVATILSDNNNFYNVSYIGWRSSTYPTLTNWQTGLGGCPATNKDCNSITGNPSFISTSNLKLSAGSSCLDAGINLGTPYSIDRGGNVRPSSGAWDIGAYEMVGTSLAAPLNLKIQQN